MNRKGLMKICILYSATISNIGRGEFVSMDILYRIGTKLNVNFGEMVSIIRESKDK